MNTAWDPKKAEINFQKHKIRCSDAEGVFFDPYALTIEEQSSWGEKRFVTVGADTFGRIVVVVYTYRGETIRLISARKATSGERQQYEKGI
jgi:uncharacterized DUF497 family protein